VEKRTFRDINLLVIDTAGNPIAFQDSKTPAKVGGIRATCYDKTEDHSTAKGLVEAGENM